MSVAAHSVIGEKQARTLEPLLATPVTTFELLAAKVIGAALPGIALMAACFAVYVGAVAIFAERGVWMMLLTARSLALVFVMGPLAAVLRPAAGRLCIIPRERCTYRSAARRALHRPADRSAADRAVPDGRRADRADDSGDRARAVRR